MVVNLKSKIHYKCEYHKDIIKSFITGSNSFIQKEHFSQIKKLQVSFLALKCKIISKYS